MGWNTTLVICNDALSSIAADHQVPARLVECVERASMLQPGERIDVAAGGHVNAMSIVASHHADVTSLITVGANMGLCHLQRHGWRHNEEASQRDILAQWADRLGMKLVPKDMPVPLITWSDPPRYP